MANTVSSFITHFTWLQFTLNTGIIYVFNVNTRKYNKPYNTRAMNCTIINFSAAISQYVNFPIFLEMLLTNQNKCEVLWIKQLVEMNVKKTSNGEIVTREQSIREQQLTISVGDAIIQKSLTNNYQP